MSGINKVSHITTFLSRAPIFVKMMVSPPSFFFQVLTKDSSIQVAQEERPGDKLLSCVAMLNTLLLLVCHAELNAILNKNSADIKGCTIYVALFPCNECSKLIIQAGIKEVIFYSDKYHDLPNCQASRKLLDMARVKYR